MAEGKSRTGRWLKRLILSPLFLLVAVELLYILVGNAFLQLPAGKRVLNRKPDKLSIQWQTAWTWLPGVVYVEGLQLEGKARRAEWQVAVDRGRLVIWLPSLVAKHFRLIQGRAGGAEIAVRILPPPTEPVTPRRRRRGWRVTLDGMALQPVRSVRVDDYQLAGEGTIAGRAWFQVRGPTRLSLSGVSFERARLLSGEQVAADSVALDAALDIESFVVGDDTLEDLLAGTSGRLRLEADATSLGFLDAYLSRVPWLRIGGGGHLTADLEVSDGWLAPSSEIGLTGPTLSADYFGLRATGDGEVRGRVPENAGHTELRVLLDSYTVRRLADQATLLVGRGLEMVVTNDSTAIDRPAEGIAVAVDLPATQVPDVAALAPYVPAATELRLTGGSAEVQAGLSYSTVDRTGHGSLSLTGESLAGTFRGVSLHSDVTLEAKLNDARLEDGTIDLSGTKLTIDNTIIERRSGARDTGWWGKVQVPDGRLVKKIGGIELGTLDCFVTSELRDSGPLLALIEKKVPKLVWFDRLLTVENVEANGRIQLQGPDFQLRDLEVTGGRKSRLELLAELDVEGKASSGVVFARWGKLTAAVSLDEGERDWKLTRSRAWYEEQAERYESESELALAATGSQ